mmetsp:Transcript_5632/g.11697  ORF Transcript_5632/g.11697 Transcript_5632/m.11697 type:complete len:237 (-) Transcript_5632:86-796(-)
MTLHELDKSMLIEIGAHCRELLPGLAKQHFAVRLPHLFSVVHHQIVNNSHVVPKSIALEGSIAVKSHPGGILRYSCGPGLLRPIPIRLESRLELLLRGAAVVQGLGPHVISSKIQLALLGLVCQPRSVSGLVVNTHQKRIVHKTETLEELSIPLQLLYKCRSRGTQNELLPVRLEIVVLHHCLALLGGAADSAALQVILRMDVPLPSRIHRLHHNKVHFLPPSQPHAVETRDSAQE